MKIMRFLQYFDKTKRLYLYDEGLIIQKGLA